jgi:glutaredoxin 3
VERCAENCLEERAEHHTGFFIGQPMKIRLFIKPYCPWCGEAMRWLDERGIRYETLDVISDGKALTEMVRLSGQTLAPVIDVDGNILADFGPNELEEFWH